MASPPPNSATPNGWRRRSAALRLPVDSASPPNCLATSGGQRRSRPTTLRFPADSASPPSSPATPSGCRRHYPAALRSPQRTPASLSLVVPVAPASALPAPCVSLLPRRTAPCQLRVKWCAVCSPQRLVMAINRHRVFPKRPRTGKRTLRGNISPLCIQIKLIMARIDPHVFVLPCKMPLGNTSSEDLAVKGRYFRPKPPNHA